ncbi:putative membrane protein YdbT with pleckstrin-like domain [Arcanobacterium pluranimalium]|uniref:PH domain-containing protein n=1 Tax=Arcanobacterium pluranimalium TaxID=108028 RepID=UPI00195D0ADC|nr:PH domain-containing protein [Arcanobacterium pluranimalium]MBM7825272.1 putative membrane protein YdbT with pleckstrin-like domain [Arcanobacterium pluranimalium]
MGIPQKIIGADETVVFHLREHVKAILLNIIGAIAVLILACAATYFLPESRPAWVLWLLWVVVAICVGAIFVVPWLKWYTSTYTITSRRIITRSGIFAKTGHDIPLSRISNVNYELDFIDRFFGCGTLIFETSAGNPLELKDIPHIEDIHVRLTEMLFESPDNTNYRTIEDE